MTPEQIKQKYQDMLNNEILAGPDPISWMHDDSEFIVMTATVGYSGRRCYAKVALCEVKKGVVPKMISTRAKGMRFIWELHNHLRKGRNIGSTCSIIALNRPWRVSRKDAPRSMRKWLG